jgi:hypothetical protein
LDSLEESEYDYHHIQVLKKVASADLGAFIAGGPPLQLNMTIIISDFAAACARDKNL